MFELIRESCSPHPSLCTKALSALLDVVQGHQPEALKLEPSEVVGMYSSFCFVYYSFFILDCYFTIIVLFFSEPLLELLLKLATMSHVATNDASHLTSVACSCLISLVIARGDTGKILSALAALLMCPQSIALQSIHVIINNTSFLNMNCVIFGCSYVLSIVFFIIIFLDYKATKIILHFECFAYF